MLNQEMSFQVDPREKGTDQLVANTDLNAPDREESMQEEEMDAEATEVEDQDNLSEEDL